MGHLVANFECSGCALSGGGWAVSGVGGSLSVVKCITLTAPITITTTTTTTAATTTGLGLRVLGFGSLGLEVWRLWV